MKQKYIKIGAIYLVKVFGRLAHVAIIQKCSTGGWRGLNMVKRRGVCIRTVPVYMNRSPREVTKP